MHGFNTFIKRFTSLNDLILNIIQLSFYEPQHQRNDHDLTLNNLYGFTHTNNYRLTQNRLILNRRRRSSF